MTLSKALTFDRVERHLFYVVMVGVMAPIFAGKESLAEVELTDLPAKIRPGLIFLQKKRASLLYRSLNCGEKSSVTMATAQENKLCHFQLIVCTSIVL